MSDIQQLVYASRATFQPTDNGGGVEPEVARILMQSRRNNPRRSLVGALYYGDCCFFQCLEGPQVEIDKLREQLMTDSRHRDLTVLRRQSIGSTSDAAGLGRCARRSADTCRAAVPTARQPRHAPGLGRAGDRRRSGRGIPAALSRLSRSRCRAPDGENLPARGSA